MVTALVEGPYKKVFINETTSKCIYFYKRWLDNTRNVRAYVKITLTVQMVGFLVYALPYHPVILLVARLISGIGDPFTNVVSGEVFRIYDEKGRTRAMMVMASIYSFGFIIGPGLNFLFEGVRFHVGPIPVNNLNFIGIFQAAWLLALMLVTHFLVHNCSQEFDLKEHITLHGDENVEGDKSVEDPAEGMGGSETDGKAVACYENNICEEMSQITRDDHTEVTTTESEADDVVVVEDLPPGYDEIIATANSKCNEPVTHENSSSHKTDDDISSSKNSQPPTPAEVTNKKIVPLPVVLKSLLKEPNTLLIFTATFVFVYTIMVASLLMPIIVEAWLTWSLRTFNILYTGFGIADFFFICVMTKICTTPRSIYYASLVSILSQIITCALLICLKILPRSYNRDMALVISFFVSIMFGWCFDDVLVRIILANFVPSQIQSFSEALRSGVCRISMIVASFTVAVVGTWVQWWSIGIAVLNLMLFGVFVVRAKHFIEPKLLTLSDEVGVPVGMASG